MTEFADTPDARLDRLLKSGEAELVRDLSALLDVEAGLRDAVIAAQHAHLVADVREVLDIDSGLSLITTEESTGARLAAQTEGGSEVSVEKTDRHPAKTHGSSGNPPIDAGDRRGRGTLSLSPDLVGVLFNLDQGRQVEQYCHMCGEVTTQVVVSYSQLTGSRRELGKIAGRLLDILPGVGLMLGKPMICHVCGTVNR